MKRQFSSARDYMDKRMAHLQGLYTYKEDGSIEDLNRSFSWRGYNAFELDLFVSDIANFEAIDGLLLFK